MYRCIVLAWGLVFASLPAVMAQDKVVPFAVNISSTVNMDADGKKQVIDAKTALAYRWANKGTERTLSYDSTQVNVQIDAKSTLDMVMSREKVIVGSGDQKKETLFKDCPENQQKMLQDSFAVALCKLQVDANRVETKRDVVAGEGAKVMIDNGMIANAVLFHAPFFADKPEWEADREISMGNSGFAKGKLTYKRVAGKEPPTVTVTGKLANAKHKLPTGPISIVDANYDVTGEQTFDPAVGEWTAGKLAIEMSFDIANEAKKIGSAKGTMTQTLEYKPQP